MLLLLYWGIVHDPKTGGTLVKDLKALFTEVKVYVHSESYPQCAPVLGVHPANNLK